MKLFFWKQKKYKMNERLSETRGKGEILFSKSGYSGSFFCVFGFMIRDPGIRRCCLGFRELLSEI